MKSENVLTALIVSLLHYYLIDNFYHFLCIILVTMFQYPNVERSSNKTSWESCKLIITLHDVLAMLNYITTTIRAG